MSRGLSIRRAATLWAAVVWAASSWLGTSLTAQAQPPKLTGSTPLAIPPGTTTQLTLTGTELANPADWWSNFGPESRLVMPAGLDKNGTLKDRCVVEITTPATTPLGVYGVRLATDKGASNVRLVMVDDLPTVTQTSNTTLATAQDLPLPVAVEGACTAEAFHYFKFRAEAGARISVDVWARRLGSPLDSIIRLLDASGRELAYSDDDESAETDSRFSLRIPAAGEYFLELRDIRYQGGGNHRFRLRVGDFPLVATAFPLGVQAGATTRVEVTGPGTGEAAAIELAAPAKAEGLARFTARFPEGKAAAGGFVAVGSGPEQIELEPNDGLDAGTPITLAGAINGRFNLPKDRDVYRFEAKKGDRFLFIGQTRTLGAPTDLLLRAYNSAGQTMVEADDAGLDEGTLDFNCPADGVYRLAVEELFGRGGSPHVYRILIVPHRPGFALQLEADVRAKIEGEPFNAPRGGSFSTKVTVVRRDYDGPITLSVEGLGDGIKLTNEVIAQGKADTVLQVTLPQSLEPGRLYPVRIVGTAKIGESAVSAAAGTLNAARAQFNGLVYPPAWVDGLAFVGIGPPAAPPPDFVNFTLEPASLKLVQLTTEGTIKLKAERLNKFDDVLTFAFDQLPAGFAASGGPIEKGKADGELKLKLPAALPPGRYTLPITVSAKVETATRTMTLAVPFEIVAAGQVGLSVSVSGKEPKLLVKLERGVGISGEGTITLANLPRGVSPGVELKLAANQNQLEVPLKVEANALPGVHEVVASVTLTVNQVPVRLDSRPVELEIVK